MAQNSPRDDLFPPSFCRRFTNFATEIDLSVSTPVGSNIKHLPCFLVIEADDTDVFEFKDVLGNVGGWTYVSEAVQGVRIMASKLTTNNTVISVTAFWMPSP